MSLIHHALNIGQSKDQTATLPKIDDTRHNLQISASYERRKPNSSPRYETTFRSPKSMYKHFERPSKGSVDTCTFLFSSVPNIFQTGMVQTVYRDISTRHRSPSKPERNSEKRLKRGKHKNTKAL